jgi:hypothetical protein
MDRRGFLKSAGAGVLAAGTLCDPAGGRGAQAVPSADRPLEGRRILTFNSIIRVNQIEVSRTRNEGFDEADRHTPENVRALRAAFAAGWPGAPMTWAFSWRALFDERENYRRIRELVAGFHDAYGDDVTFIPGAYFANAYNTREQVNRDLHEGLARVSEIMGGRFRPKSVIAGFLAAANQKFLAEEEGIRVCQGSIWSQFAIDNQDGDGSVCYPYYPSTEHFCKPAQGPGDFVDAVCLDGWTCDFVAARRPGLGPQPQQPAGRGADRDDRLVRPGGRTGPDGRDDRGPFRRGIRAQRLGLGDQLLGDFARPPDQEPGRPDALGGADSRALAWRRMPDDG